MHAVTASAHDLARWSETLAAIARTGLGFTQSLYERERFEEVLHVAADIKAAAREIDEAVEVERETDHFVQEWMESIGEGVPGYVTPKVAIGAIVGNDARRAAAGAAQGFGDLAVPDRLGRRRLLAGRGGREGGRGGDRHRMRPAAAARRWSTVSAWGSAASACTCCCSTVVATGGALRPHPLETADVGWFGDDALPEPTAGAAWWGPMAFAAIRGEESAATFDPVRSPVWRVE